MNGQKFLVATVAGGIALFVLGFILWGLLFMSFFQAHATADVMKEVPTFWALILGQLSFAALLTVIIGKWAGTTGVVPGMKTAALVGLLMALGIDFTLFATAEMMDLTATLVDPLLVTVQSGGAGAVIGGLLGRGADGTAA